MPLAHRPFERSPRVRPPAHATPARQRGSFAVAAVAWLLVAIATLGAIDIGHVFFVRRDLQKVADMAAIAAAQRIVNDACTEPAKAAASNAAANGFDPAASGNTLVAPVCGRWDPQRFPSVQGYFVAQVEPLNAVQVTVEQDVPFFFVGPRRTLSATSIAKATNTDQFTVGTTLASLQGGLVNGLLGALLHTNLSLTVGAYQALAATQIKISDLVVAANVTTVDALLNTQITAAQFMQLMIDALTRTQVVNASRQISLDAMQSMLSAGIGGGNLINLGSRPGAPGVISLGLSDKQAALDAKVNLFDMLMVAAEVGQAGQPAINVPVGLNLGIVHATLNLQINTPPSIALGEAGIDPATGDWRTQTSNAMVRLYLDIALDTEHNQISAGLLAPVLSLLQFLLGNLVQISVHVPIVLEVSTGRAWLEQTNCESTASASTAVVGVQPGLANLCIGQLPSGDPNTSLNSVCSQPTTILSLGVLHGRKLIELKTKGTQLPVETPQSDAVKLTFNGVTGDADDYQSANSNAVGSQLANALSQLASSWSQPKGLDISILDASLPLEFILNPLLNLLTGVLTPILGALDQVVVPLLNLLGVQVGVATVHNEALTCGAAQTVY
ncbi:TadG family pilus assembly protein [Burkholderia singularis]|uniref:Probable transmembrane protein n=1 Tax=Burkholderia singularis TaxID=1503053 RepID=A0A238H062_9BURK|nr:TadG family pilus assembly protein [Burkholderia singularis]SMF98582.1 Probable transmembrane protein [Burkholderia singularis]